MKEILRLLWFFLLFFLALASCEDDVSEGTYRGITGIINNMPPLPEQYEYAAWLIENDNTRLINTVSPDDEGIVRIAFAPLADHIAQAEVIFFTIEEKGSAYSTPSDITILGCRFNQSDQSTIRPYTISQDFSGLEGSFILDSPTSNSGDNYSGIWFVKEDGTAGLNLSILDQAWQYEAWVHEGNQMISVGKFTNSAAADLQNIYGGDLAGYQFPGEDFINQDLAPLGVEFPLDLRGNEVSITLEPNPDISPLPFGLTVLNQLIDDNASANSSIQLQNLVDHLPSGTMTKER